MPSIGGNSKRILFQCVCTSDFFRLHCLELLRGERERVCVCKGERERERKINWLYPLELRRTGEPRPHLPTSLPSLAPFGQSSCPDLRQIRKTIKEGNPQTDDLKGKEQCDLIGRFLKVLGNKVPFKSSPNIWQQIWAIVKNGTFYIKLMWILFGQLL